jgi:hypothetical protein
MYTVNYSDKYFILSINGLTGVQIKKDEIATKTTKLRIPDKNLQLFDLSFNTPQERYNSNSNEVFFTVR